MIETPRLILRRWKDSDRPAFAAICADPEVMQWLGGVLTPEQAGQRIDRVEATFEALGYGRFLVERKSDGAFLGWCGVMPCHESVTPIAGQPEIGWRLVTTAWGEGYATEAARAALDDAFARVGLAEVLAYTSKANLRSQAVMQRLGLSREPQRDFHFPNTPAGEDPTSVVYVAYP
ncbi:GNAT family N-acetyltransferase [Phenylobacterium sp.]|uniref:GNAT family N-acetyltransferase n=1 Tax=Phenylobacterium sp. TaxID=1871053 RepID=UPI0035B2E879